MNCESTDSESETDNAISINMIQLSIHSRTAKISYNVQLSTLNFQITQKEFEQLADLLLKYPKAYATSKFDVGKLNSPLHLPLKPDAVFKKTTSKQSSNTLARQS